MRNIAKLVRGAALGGRPWWREMRKRWPVILAVLRDGTVIYKAEIHGQVWLHRPHSYVADSRFRSPSPVFRFDGPPNLGSPK